MDYCFDEVINRRNYNSTKHRLLSEDKVIPLWVADMDFKSPPEVAQALSDFVQHGIFGYTTFTESYEESVCAWFSRNFNWPADPKWNIRAPGVVFALAAAIKTVSEEGDAILIQPPVYHPFAATIKANNRRVVNNPLLLQDNRYQIDFLDLENKIITEKVKALIFCSPHNPVGRVWTKKELLQLQDICLRHQLYVISDEIHCDFVYPLHQHHILAGLSLDMANLCITLTAPSKTFNIAGLQAANTFIVEEELRERYKKEFNKTAYHDPGTFGIVAAEACYRYGQKWHDELILYLYDNMTYIKERLINISDKIKLIEPEGTYLLWLDCRALGLDDEELNTFFYQQAKLWLNRGLIFGIEGSGFMRMNIASPKSVIIQALNQLEAALKTLL